MASYPPLGTPTGPTPGLLERGNIALSVRPRARTPGGIGTIYSTSRGIDGKEVLLPRISEEGLMSEEDALQHYLETGEHLGMFETPEDASAYGARLSQAQGERPPLTLEDAKRRGILRALQEMGP